MLFHEKFTFNSHPHATVSLARDNTHSFNESVGEVLSSFVHPLEYSFIPLSLDSNSTRDI